MAKINSGFSSIMAAIIVAAILVVAGTGLYFYNETTEEEVVPDTPVFELGEVSFGNIETQEESEDEKNNEDELADEAKEDEDIEAEEGNKEDEEGLEMALKEAFSDRYSRIIDDINIRIDKAGAKHVFGSVSFVGEMGGGWFLAYKDDTDWMIVDDGNGTIDCDVIAPYDFPVDVVGECVDESGEVVER